MGISLYRAIASQYTNLRQVHTVPLMNTISHLIEDQVIEHGMPIDFYAGFQRFSYFPAQLRRYSKLGAVCRRVYVLGVPDVPPPSIPGVEFVRLEPGSDLAREWFVVVDTPAFWVTLLTQEASGRDAVTGGRRFDGLWSYDALVAERASLLVSQQLGKVYQPVAVRDHVQQSLHIAQMSSRLLNEFDMATQLHKRRWAQLCTVQQVVDATFQHRGVPLVNGCPLHLLQKVVQVLHSIFGAADVAIAFHDHNDTYRVVAAEGDTPMYQQVLRSGVGPSGRALQEGVVVHVADAQRSGARDPLLPGSRSVLSAPLVGQMRTYGVVTVGEPATGSWTDADADTLRMVATLLALAIEQEAVNGQADGTQRERMQRLEHILRGLRQPVTQLLEVQRQLQAFNGATPQTHQPLLAQSQALAVALGRALHVPIPPTLEAASQGQHSRKVGG